MRGPFYIKLLTTSFILLSFTALSNESKWNLIYKSDEVTIETKNQNCDFPMLMTKNLFF